MDVSTQNGIPKSENNALNGVVMLEDNSVELQDTKQKSDFVEESDKDWGDWERYVTESRIVSKQNCLNEHSP